MEILIKPTVITILSFIGLFKTTESLTIEVNTLNTIIFLVCALIFAFGILEFWKQLKILKADLWQVIKNCCK